MYYLGAVQASVLCYRESLEREAITGRIRHIPLPKAPLIAITIPMVLVVPVSLPMEPTTSSHHIRIALVMP